VEGALAYEGASFVGRTSSHQIVVRSVSWLLKLHARAPKIANTTITNQQEVLGLLAVLKQQQTLYITVET
jgi:hypothetical protein